MRKRITDPRCGCGKLLDSNGHCLIGDGLVFDGKLRLVGLNPHHNKGKKLRLKKAS